MTNIAFYANGQRLEMQSEPIVVAKSRNEYTAAFSFTEDWKDITKKTAVFRRFSDGQSFTVDLDNNGKCKVPWEVIETPRFYVSVYGGNLRTMTEVYVNVEKTGYDENAVQSGTVPQINPTPTDLEISNDNLHMVANGEKIGNGVEMPPVPTDLKLENNQLQLIAGNTAIGNGVQIRKTPTLLDTFTIAEGEDPVLFFEKKLAGQGWKHIWLSGEIYSSDKSNATQTFHIRTSAGSEIFRQSFKSWDKGRVFVSAEMCRMPNGLVIGEIALSLHQYTNEIGIYSKSVGRFNTQYLLGVHISLDNQTQMFAAGTRIEVWGLE